MGSAGSTVADVFQPSVFFFVYISLLLSSSTVRLYLVSLYSQSLYRTWLLHFLRLYITWRLLLSYTTKTDRDKSLLSQAMQNIKIFHYLHCRKCAAVFVYLHLYYVVKLWRSCIQSVYSFTWWMAYIMQSYHQIRNKQVAASIVVLCVWSLCNSSVRKLEPKV